MEQFIFEVQHLADTAIHTLDQIETLQLIAGDGAGNKCELYYI